MLRTRSPLPFSIFYLLVVVVIFMILPAALAAISTYWQPVTNLIVIRDVMFVVSIPLLLILPTRPSRVLPLVLIAALPLIALLAFQFERDGAPIDAKLASLRQIISPIILLIFAVLATNIGSFYSRFLPALINVLAAIALFGLFERITHFWRYTNILPEYFQAKNIGILGSGYPFLFIEPSAFSEFAEHSGLLRASSTLLDPINFGHTMAAAVVLLVLIKREAPEKLKNRFLQLWFLFVIATAASLCKGAMLQVGVLCLLFREMLPIPYARLPLAIVGLIFGMAYIITHPGFLVHLTGLQEAITSASFFGLGLARAGNYATMFNTQLSYVGDTFIGAVIGQIGMVGLLLWLAPFLALSKLDRHGSTLLPLALLWTQVGVSVLSENAFNLGSVFIPITVAAAFLLLDAKRTSKFGVHPSGRSPSLAIAAGGRVPGYETSNRYH